MVVLISPRLSLRWRWRLQVHGYGVFLRVHDSAYGEHIMNDIYVSEIGTYCCSLECIGYQLFQTASVSSLLLKMSS